MPTILLEEIIAILKGWISDFTNYAAGVMEKLGLIEEDTSNLPDIKSNTDNIKDNTAAIITPISVIQGNTTTISTDVASIKTDTGIIKNNASSIATSAGSAAAFAEDCANNTLDISNKVVTIASDTTQLRSDSGNILTAVNSINQSLGYYIANTPVTEDSEGAICNFDTDLTDYLQKAVLTIPSDANGISSVDVNKRGFNLVPFDSVIGEGWTNSQDGITATYSNGYFHVYGTNELNTWNNIALFSNAWLNNEILLPPGTYAMGNHIVVRVSTDGINYVNKAQVETYNTSIKIRGFYIAVRALETVDWYIPMTFILGNSFPTTYEPYKSTTDTVSLGSTITDGAEIDLLSGLMKVNTTPATYTQLTPIAIRTYKGVNNIYADVGDMSVTYRETLKHYLDKQEA